MIHEVGVELAAAIGAKGCPFSVVDGPELRPTVTFARERIVIEHDMQGSGDRFESRHQTDKNPRTRMTRVVACKITIYAQNASKGSTYWEHKRRAEHALDLVLVALDVIAKQRKNIFRPTSGKFVFPEDLKASETHAGAVYELLFSFDRGVADRHWDGTGDPTFTIVEGTIQNKTQVSGVNGETETAAGG